MGEPERVQFLQNIKNYFLLSSDFFSSSPLIISSGNSNNSWIFIQLIVVLPIALVSDRILEESGRHFVKTFDSDNTDAFLFLWQFRGTAQPLFNV